MRIGIDLGGSKIEGIALNSSGEELIRHRVVTPAGNYKQTLKSITDLVNYIETATAKTGSVGIGAPGSISTKTYCLRNSNSVCLNGQPIKTDLENLLKREIRISNDANCFALSEATDGAGKNAAVVFGVIIGTGTGAGVVVHGKVLTGANAIAGEWGHNPLPWVNENEIPGPVCYCGKQGCIETFISGPGLAAEYYSISHKKLTAINIVELASKHDKQAEECIQRYEHRLARSLAHIINILDPDVIVLGGGMSNVSRLYNHVPELWGEYVFSDVINTKLLQAVHGDSSGVRGAAWLWE